MLSDTLKFRGKRGKNVDLSLKGIVTLSPKLTIVNQSYMGQPGVSVSRSTCMQAW